MNLHADVRAIRAVAPKGMRWLCVTLSGSVYWQYRRGHGYAWIYSDEVNGKTQLLAANDTPATKHLEHTPFAIDLTTGSVHLQDELGKITVVEQSAWVAARGRKGRK